MSKIKRYRVSNRRLIVGRDAPDVFDLHNLDVVLAEDYEVLERRCKGLETTAIRLEGELAECKGYLAAAEKGHDAAHDACVEYDAHVAMLEGRIAQLDTALRDIRPYLDSLICYASTIGEHLPNGFPARVDELLRETDSVSISSKSASAPVAPAIDHGFVKAANRTDCAFCGRLLRDHGSAPETETKP